MADFTKVFQATMGNEGGYANNPNDRGGETYAGISRKNFPAWAGWVIIDGSHNQPNFPDNLKGNTNLSNLVQAFYKANFWNILKLDQVADQHIATELFDLGVNCGTGVAAELLQRSLNVLNDNARRYADIVVDGGIGPGTLAAIAKANQKDLLKCIVALQGAKYIAISEKNRSQEEFMAGWIRRAFDQFTLIA